MFLRRRPVLAAPFLLLGRPARAASHFALLQAGPDRANLGVAGCAETISLPSARARLVAVMPLAALEIAAFTFAADRERENRDLLALAVWDHAIPRLIALETWSSTRADGASLSRPHRRRRRRAAHPYRAPRRHAAPRQAESLGKLDRLPGLARSGPAGGQPCSSAPLAGTAQAALAEQRRGACAALARPRRDIDAGLLREAGLAREACMPPRPG